MLRDLLKFWWRPTSWNAHRVFWLVEKRMSRFALRDSLLSIQHRLEQKDFEEYISVREAAKRAASERIQRYRESHQTKAAASNARIKAYYESLRRSPQGGP